MTQLSAQPHFSTPIYSVHDESFLTDIKRISEASLNKAKNERGFNENFPVLMSENFFAAPEARNFSDFVGQSSWQILKEQGYAMDSMVVQFTEMWTQRHHKHSLMEQHSHRFGSQIVGFYFLEVPEEAPRALFYDPRISRLHSSLPEADPAQLTSASSIVNYEPKPGLFIFTNSWLAHSFTKNITSEPFSFVHFNLTVAPVQQGAHVASIPEVEVI
jgi:uncharacterized protein (TIGR02466 family)